MRGISTAATCVIAAIVPYACLVSSDESSGSSSGGPTVTVGGFPGGATSTSTSTTGRAANTGGSVGSVLEAFDADTLPGDAGSGGAAGGTGRAGAPGASPAPVVPEGALLAAAWDDNVNFDWFTRREAPSGSAANALPQLDAALVAEAHEQAQSPRSEHAFLDIALVLDTTGSMGDELAY